MTLDARDSPRPAAPSSHPVVEPAAPALARGRGRTFALAAMVVTLDQTVKLTLNAVLPAEGTRVLRIFDFQRVYNPGINFGALREYPSIVLIASIVIGLAFTLYVLWRPPRSWGSVLGFGLLLGGGLGNVIDRIRLGAVFDYLNITPFVGYLNLADLAIGGGILVALLDALWPRKRPLQAPPR